jgi:hypothetical protein
MRSLFSQLIKIVHAHQWAVGFFLLFGTWGIIVHGDYGITWDEKYQHDYGQFVHHYLFYGDTFLLEYESRYHGPAFQFVLYQVEHWMQFDEPGDIYRLRHLLTFLFSIVGGIFFYAFSLAMFKRPVWALLAVVFLMLSPQILSHSFYNSKDASFMFMFIIAMHSMMRVIRHPDWRTVVIHALVCAWLIDIRVLGAFVPMITFLLMLPRMFLSLKEASRLAVLGCLFSIILWAGIVAFWPTLWHAPLEEFYNALTRMSAYPWSSEILFRGQFLTPSQLPWYYLPWWMIISTPMFMVIAIGIGVFTWFLRSNKLNASYRMAVAIWAILPLFVIVGNNAVVYDGWRHVFFVYPALVIIGVAGLRWMVQQMEVYVPRLLLWLLIFVPLGHMAAWNILNHPFQNVYFNSLARDDAWKNYEMDYWGGSYKQAFEWLLMHEPEGLIRIEVANMPGDLNQLMFPQRLRDRLYNTTRDSAQYFISNHRFPIEFRPFVEGSYPYEHPVHQIRVDGNVIVGVYALEP